jgi:RimJ/RimL family protein N-acetyltransferase
MSHSVTHLALREFRPSDADTVVAWLRGPDEALAVAGSGAPWPYPARALVSADAAPGCHPRVLTWRHDSGAVLGHVAVVRVGPDAGRLARVVLAPHLRGRGLSGSFLALAVAEARALGIHELALFVVPGNEPALRAYAAAGFRRTEPDVDHPEYVRLVRRLDAPER